MSPHVAIRPRPLASTLVLSGAAMLLGGCETFTGLVRGEVGNPMASEMPETRLHAAIPGGKLNTASRQLAAEGLKALDARDYRKASDLFNLAVKTDITNSYLHFLAGVAYQLRGIAGESGLFPLAEQGYQMAVQFDNSNWLARYYAGLLAMYQRNWAAAQAKLADAALYAGNQPDLLYDLAVASYYNRDPKTAAGALAGLRELQGGEIDPRVLRASAIVAAAMNQGDDARSFLDQLRSATHRREEIGLAEQRVAAWQAAHAREGLVKTQFPTTGGFPQQQTQQGYPSAGGFPGTGGFPSAGGFPGSAQGGFPGAGTFPGQAGVAGRPGFGGFGGFVEKQMAVVDVVIISTEEDNTSAMGVNLLDGLKLQFGNPTTQTPGYSRQTNRSTDIINAANNTGTNVVTRLIQIPALSYSLNIANAAGKHNEVLARPTLVALGNQTSNFFSGVDVNAAAVSNGQGSAVQIQKEVGVKLSVTPEFLPDNLVKLNIVAERTFLAIPSNSVKFDFRLDTTKTMVNANVVMKFGETLILSGLSERDQSRDRDGVPVLQDIPIVQYLFSRNVERNYYKSVLILLTPRKAQYTNRADEDIAADKAQATPGDLALAEFEAKYRPWFKPIPNIGEIVQRLEGTPLYREFRTGDIAGSWQSAHNHESRLKAAIDFLFF